MTLSRVENPRQETFLHTARVPFLPRHDQPRWQHFIIKAGLQADILRLSGHSLITLRKEVNNGGEVCLLKGTNIQRMVVINTL